jgi:hypothetical protein
MRKMSANTAIAAGLNVMAGNEDLALSNDIKETMKQCGYTFNETSNEPTELDATVATLVKAFNKNLPVIINVLPDSEIAKKYHCTQYDYVNAQPVSEVRITKGIKADAPSKVAIRSNKRKDAEEAMKKSDKPATPAVNDKSAWTAPATKEAANNNGDNAEQKKGNDTMKETTVTKIEKALEKTEDTAKNEVMKTIAALGADTKKKFAPLGIAPSKAAAAAATGRKTLVLSDEKTDVGNAFWYRDVEGLDGINAENAPVRGLYKIKDHSLFGYRVRFTEPVMGLSRIDIYKTNMKGVLYVVDIKAPGLPICKGFKIRYTKANNGVITIFDPSFKSGEKDGKPVYYSHVQLRDKDGKLYEDCVPLAAAILSTVEAVMLDIDGVNTPSEDDDE